MFKNVTYFKVTNSSPYRHIMGILYRNGKLSSAPFVLSHLHTAFVFSTILLNNNTHPAACCD